MSNPANAFVDSTRVDARGIEEITVDYHRVAEQIRALKPRELNTEQLDDVLTLIEWMQEQCLVTHEKNLKTSAALDVREKAISDRERTSALRLRTVQLVHRASIPVEGKKNMVQRLLRR